MERPPERKESVPAYPANAEIKATLTKMSGSREYTFAQQNNDAQGDIIALAMMLMNQDGTKEEFQYVRSRERVDEEDVPVILVTDIRNDGSLAQSAILAEFKNGEWEMRNGEHYPPKV